MTGFLSACAGMTDFFCHVQSLFSLKTDFSGLLSKWVSGKSRIFNQNQYNPEILY